MGQPTPHPPAYFSPSARATPAGLAIALVVTLFFAVGGAVIYTELLDFIPLLYFNVVSVFAFGWVLGRGVGLGANLGKLRSPRTVTRLAIVAALVGYLVAWVAWFENVFSKSGAAPSGSFADPRVFWHALQVVYENGTWGIGGSYHFAAATHAAGMQAQSPNVNGVLLVLVWVGEALGIFGAAIVVAHMRMSDRAFCEPCNAWCRSPELVHSYAASVSPVEVKIHLEQRDWRFLATLPRPRYGESRRTDIVVETCPRCGRTIFLTVRTVRVAFTRTGAVTHDYPVLHRMVITADELAQIRSLSPQNPAPEPQPRQDAWADEDLS